MNEEASQTQPTQSHDFPVFKAGLLSMVAMWLSFPPVGWSWLAWIGPIPILILIVKKNLARLAENVQDSEVPVVPRWTYWKLFLVGLLYWLGTFYFIPIPHPALYGGWLLVSLYMGIYTPMLVGVSRLLVHQLRCPALLIVPIVWTGIEWIRCRFATGMGMVCLSHSQYQQPVLIQVADLSGAYTLTFAMVFVVTGLTVAVNSFLDRSVVPKASDFKPGRKMLDPVAVAIVLSVAMLASVIGYGKYRLGEVTSQIKSNSESNDDGDVVQVGLVQTSFDVVFEALTKEKLDRRWNEIQSLCLRSLQRNPKPQLLVWPEGVFAGFVDYLSDGPYGTVQEIEQELQFMVGAAKGELQRPDQTPVIAGILTKDPQKSQAFNAAVHFDSSGLIQQRYYKQHLVMFGEYVPLADQVPLISRLSPMGRNLNVGNKYETFTIRNVNFAPSICFETTVPHLIRRQINELESTDVQVDAMVNLTNDGWFFGTSCLDFHLACNVFRAVEMRKHHLVCANTGLSAHIDPAGRLLQLTKRRQPDVLVVPVYKTKGMGTVGSWYRRFGDIVPRLFGYVVLFGLGLLIAQRFIYRKSERKPG